MCVLYFIVINKINDRDVFPKHDYDANVKEWFALSVVPIYTTVRKHARNYDTVLKSVFIRLLGNGTLASSAGHNIFPRTSRLP